ncbi:MAG TPA: BON domain-containing protein [Thermoanaerobaculia bacterium]|nr:BON domain-containing protein [Thermoanaerobaculia bacterium]
MRANNVRIGVAVAVMAVIIPAIPAMAQQPATHDLTQQFLNAGVAVEGLRAVEVGGIVVLRGTTVDRNAAEKAGSVAQVLGYTRVANLIQVADVPDDARIKRIAERELGSNRSLDGTEIAVESTNGVVRLRGTVSSELQKDMALTLVRNIAGVRSVTMALRR